MSRTDEYRRNAEGAERRAEDAATEDERTAYEQIACGWRSLERQAALSERRGR